MLYFARTDDDIAFSNDVAQAHYLIIGKKIDPTNNEEIRRLACHMDGLKGELDNPSVEYLVKHGHVVSAVRLYRELHDCTLREAHDAVQKIVESLQSEES
jgi:hypothetical protein